MALERLRASLAGSPVVRFGDYDYFVHPITDGIPLGDPKVLEEVSDALARLGEEHEEATGYLERPACIPVPCRAAVLGDPVERLEVVGVETQRSRKLRVVGNLKLRAAPRLVLEYSHEYVVCSHLLASLRRPGRKAGREREARRVERATPEPPIPPRRQHHGDAISRPELTRGAYPLLSPCLGRLVGRLLGAATGG